jgi:hypothetical protein
LENENKFDFVLSHTGPYKINMELAGGIGGGYEKMKDTVGKLNEYVDKKIEHRGWFCGHWHCDYFNDTSLENKYVEKKKYFYLYNDTILLNGDKQNKFRMKYDKYSVWTNNGIYV